MSCIVPEVLLREVTMLSKTTRLFKLQLGEPFSRALASGSPVVTAISVQPRLLHSFLSLSPIHLRRLSDSPRYPITKRHPALRKPPITEKTRLQRLAIANERIDWSLQDWEQVLWSDETWVTAGRHRKTYVTRRRDEAYDPTCIVEKVQRKGGWMFWGCFSMKYGKGPCLFWEKDGVLSRQTPIRHESYP